MPRMYRFVVTGQTACYVWWAEAAAHAWLAPHRPLRIVVTVLILPEGRFQGDNVDRVYQGKKIKFTAIPSR